MRGRRLALLLAAALLGSASDAIAYCRSTTAKTEDNHDSTKAGCPQGGVPVFWRNACVGYSIARHASRKIAYDDASNLIAQAFTRWSGATCPSDPLGRSRPSIDVRDLGPVDCTNIEYVTGAANQNVITFHDDSWPHDATVLGLTTVIFAPDTGEIYGADMELNTYKMDPLAKSDSEIRPGAYDFLSIVTHEAGHFLGMAHSDVEHTTMYASYDQNEPQTYQRYLAPDDIQGICEIYRPDGHRAVLKGEVYAAPGCDPTPRGGFSTSCQEKPGFRCDNATSPARPSNGVLWTLALAAAIFGWRGLRAALRARGPRGAAGPAGPSRRSGEEALSARHAPCAPPTPARN